jgi:hypothetical protein
MRSKVQVLLAVVALASSGCPLPQPPLPSSQAPGVWAARVPGPEGGARIVTLWLQSGGVATLETVDIGKERLPPVHGVWSATGDEVIVQLRGEDGQPSGAPLVYTIGPDRLEPKQWDHDVYGPTGLPLTRRNR